MVGLTLLWCGVLLVALALLLLGGRADAMTYDEPGLPPSEVLAGLYYAASGVAVAVAVVLAGVELAVRAVLWHLDPAMRIPPEPAPEIEAFRQADRRPE